MLNEPLKFRICILELSKVLMHKFHYDYRKETMAANTALLITDIDINYLLTDTLYQIETRGKKTKKEIKKKEMFNSSNSFTKLKYCNN